MKFETTYCGRPFSFEINDLARRADQSVLVRYGDTTVLVALVVDENEREGIDFTPLTIEYEERYYAAGKIFGSRFMRREGRPSPYAILNGRLIDRTVRPLFPKHFRHGVQLNTLVLSLDPDADPDIPSMLGASLALSLSPIAWRGPIGAIRISRKDGEIIKNPPLTGRDEYRATAVFAGPRDRINMIEVEASEVSEDEVIALAEAALPEMNAIVDFQKEIVAKLNPAKQYLDAVTPKELLALVRSVSEQTVSLSDIFPGPGKEDPAQLWLDKLESAVVEAAVKEDPEWAPLVGSLVEDFIEDFFTHQVLTKHERPDGRKISEIRPLNVVLDPLPRVHGSAIFYRGLTHTLSAVTLGSPVDELMIKDIEFEGTKRFIHHYNFPNFSTHELGPTRSPGRREIGHGALAEKAVARMIPPQTEFPYTIRAVSEVLSSNGSTSMASTCSTSLALMVAGVPLKRNIGGVSIGLMHESDEAYELVTDIQGPEDHYGDMDFKVAGTSAGITAVQMDTKIDGITLKMFREALARAREGRETVLAKMDAAIKSPSATFKANVPRIKVIQVDPSKIGMIIGSGGKTINEIIQKSGAQIDIEEDGVFIVSESDESIAAAEAMIRRIVKEVAVGDIVTAKVIRIREFGAIVGIPNGPTALLHVNEFKDRRLPRDFAVGKMVPVVIKSVDVESGKMNVGLVPDGENH